ncbi:hypothetical protein KCV06_g6, partial [Aureobasidium melanogenum]
MPDSKPCVHLSFLLSSLLPEPFAHCSFLSPLLLIEATPLHGILDPCRAGHKDFDVVPKVGARICVFFTRAASSAVKYALLHDQWRYCKGREEGRGPCTTGSDLLGVLAIPRCFSFSMIVLEMGQIVTGVPTQNKKSKSALDSSDKAAISWLIYSTCPTLTRYFSQLSEAHLVPAPSSNPHKRPKSPTSQPLNMIFLSKAAKGQLFPGPSSQPGLWMRRVAIYMVWIKWSV